MTTDFWEIVSNRRSIRQYKPEEVPNSVLMRVIEVGAYAPSAHNKQPWHFVVVKSPTIKKRLVQKMADKYNDDLISNHVPDPDRAKRINRSLRLLGQAPVIVIAYLIHGIDEASGRYDTDASNENIMDIQSVAVSIGYLLLAATANGLGACWYSAPLFCPEVVNTEVKVHADWRPQALITLGYPDESPAPRGKKTFEEMVTYV